VTGKGLLGAVNNAEVVNSNFGKVPLMLDAEYL
jgi:hypothetical protein